MQSKIPKYNMIDLFSGVGGLSCGFMMEGFTPIFANDFDKEISDSYIYNHPNIEFYFGDIKKLDYNVIGKECDIKIDEVDIIVGGPPCQGYSMANRKRIENDSRNFLFLEFVRCVKHFQPKCFLIENVLGMNAEKINEDNEDKSVMNTMHDYFKGIGYEVVFTSFKSEEYGVPQYRRRIMIIGTCIKDRMDPFRLGNLGLLTKSHKSIEMIRNKGNSDQLSFELADNNKLLNPVTVWEAISDLPEIEAGEGSNEMDYLKVSQNDYQKIMRKNSIKLYNHKSTPHSEEALKRIKLIKQGENFRNLPEELKTKSVHSGAYGRLEQDFLSPTITTRFDTPSTGRVIHPFNNRTLTVREAARLQSFPDAYKFIGSRTSQGKQIGNAVPPLVAKAIAKMFINDFLS